MFKECPHPDDKQRMRLSTELGLKPRQVKLWFQNRWTQMKAQHDRANNVMLRAENENLKTENYRLQAAVRSVACRTCGGPAVLGEVSYDELENARLKEENSRGSEDGEDSGTSTPLRDRKLLVLVLDKLQKKDTYGVYSEPVDPVELSDYHDIIKHPMDFRKVWEKLADGAYANLEQFENPRGSEDGVDSGTSTPLRDRKLLVLVLDRLQKKDTYGVYSEPVDPEELPDYHDIIKHPMDFRTVREKLAYGAYANLEQFEAM